jgi:hypothetical protein
MDGLILMLPTTIRNQETSLWSEEIIAGRRVAGGPDPVCLASGKE